MEQEQEHEHEHKHGTIFLYGFNMLETKLFLNHGA